MCSPACGRMTAPDHLRRRDPEGSETPADAQTRGKYNVWNKITGRRGPATDAGRTRRCLRFPGPLAQEPLSAVCPDAVRCEIATLLADSSSIGLLDRERPAGWEDFVDRVQLAAPEAPGGTWTQYGSPLPWPTWTGETCSAQADFAADLCPSALVQVSARAAAVSSESPGAGGRPVPNDGGMVRGVR